MKLKDLHISGFGKYTHEDLSFTDGINVIYGDNGSGKSTLHAYLRAMLFGMERGRGRAASTDPTATIIPGILRLPTVVLCRSGRMRMTAIFCWNGALIPKTVPWPSGNRPPES